MNLKIFSSCNVGDNNNDYYLFLSNEPCGNFALAVLKMFTILDLNSDSKTQAYIPNKKLFTLYS